MKLINTFRNYCKKNNLEINPSQMIEDTLKESLNAEMFIQRYSNISEGS